MKTSLKNLKSDFHRVFVDGNANNQQMLVVYLVLTIPSIVALFSVCHGVIR